MAAIRLLASTSGPSSASPKGFCPRLYADVTRLLLNGLAKYELRRMFSPKTRGHPAVSDRRSTDCRPAMGGDLTVFRADAVGLARVPSLVLHKAAVSFAAIPAATAA